MNTAVMVEPAVEEGSSVDPVEEIRLRTWARRHYKPASQREDNLHPVILDEMARKDQENNRPHAGATPRPVRWRCAQLSCTPEG
jgi:hypothetical protein